MSYERIHKGTSSPTHEILIRYAKDRLERSGHYNVETNYKLPDGIIDLHAGYGWANRRGMCS